uniref:Mannosidase beta like n=1 Tax=Crocodylus porosus TaxID=8502 RepID=A0A7M4F1B4_CROPO
MAAELDFSPPEIPEPTFMENVLRYGLFFGAIFQLICVLAIILPVSKSHKTMRLALLPCVLTGWLEFISHGRNDLCHLPCRETLGYDSDGFEPKSSEVVKKPKVAAQQMSKKPKKETKKKR